jgi:hypothetical protein
MVILWKEKSMVTEKQQENKVRQWVLDAPMMSTLAEDRPYSKEDGN